MEHSAVPATAAAQLDPPDSLDQPTTQSTLTPPTPPQTKEQEHEGVDTTADLIAGWLGGAVGVIVGNPFEVLKVRLQTGFSPSSSSSSSGSSTHSSPRVGKSSVPPLPSPAFPFPPPPAPLGGSAPAPSPAAKPFPPSIASPATHTSSTLRANAAPSVAPTGATPAPLPQPKAGAAAAPLPKEAPRVGILSLYRTEGIRFFFAGTAGPILGLAFIDSAFFGLYGRVMQALGQDRQDPNALSRVFLSGATAGALCALLETPIEVVKTRAQVESTPGQKLGSFRIAAQIARTEGLRGFYIGGLMTAVHDGISSGIFFSTYFIFRRLLRGEAPFYTAPASSPLEALASPLASTAASSVPSPAPASAAASSSAAAASDTLSEPARAPAALPDEAAAQIRRDEQDEKEKGGMGKAEILRILIAGGFAGALSAVVPYPFDIVKTRLQTANFESRARSSPVAKAGTFTSNATPFHTRSSSSPSSPSAAASSSVPTGAGTKLTVPAVFRGIHAEGAASYRYRFPSTWVYQTLATYVFPSANPSKAERKASINPKAEKWALRLLGMRGFKTGMGPTVVSSFVGSAATITTVELALHFMGVNGGGGGIG
ncbi:hypothetical protein JCM10207_000400 [Rhodosporidiobolus poonsookiae]